MVAIESINTFVSTLILLWLYLLLLGVRCFFPDHQFELNLSSSFRVSRASEIAQWNMFSFKKHPRPTTHNPQQLENSKTVLIIFENTN
jgi:hypothetical protein